MNPNPNVEKDLFAEAPELPPDQREVFLKGTSRNDEPLHQRVEDLLRVHGVTFSPDGRRLISASGGREVVKLWDVGTRQELRTLSGTGSNLSGARWSADGDVILAGPPWQDWRAPSWEEIAAAEAKEKAVGGKP